MIGIIIFYPTIINSSIVGRVMKLWKNVKFRLKRIKFFEDSTEPMKTSPYFSMFYSKYINVTAVIFLSTHGIECSLKAVASAGKKQMQLAYTIWT